MDDACFGICQRHGYQVSVSKSVLYLLGELCHQLTPQPAQQARSLPKYHFETHPELF